MDQSILSDDDLFAILDDICVENDNGPVQNMNDDETCNICNSINTIIIDIRNGIIVCTKCGTVLKDILDDSQEWKNSDEDTKGRCNTVTNVLLPHSSIGTSMSGYANGRLKRIHTWIAMPYRERSLYVVFKIIEEKCNAGNILKCIQDDAKILYKKLSECKYYEDCIEEQNCSEKHEPDDKHDDRFVIIRGSNRHSLIANCVFFACKRKGTAMSLKEVADIFGITHKSMTSGHKKFIELAKHINRSELVQNTTKPENFIRRYCKKVKFNDEQVNMAIKIIRNIEKLNIASVHTSISIAAATIIIVDDTVCKKSLSEEFGISEVTIVKAYRRILQYKEILLNDELTDELNRRSKEYIKTLQVPDELKKRFDECSKLVVS
jgi:transcription initiation factor TFIIIB Brf1 subunit/transcription initiation factor TFIIB